MPPETTTLQLVPPAETAAVREPVRGVPYTQARLDKWERAKTNTRWGDLGAATLTSVLNRASTGDIADWVDLCEWAIVHDPDLMSLYDTRISRVAQADYIIKPNQFGNPQYAELAAEFINEQLGRLEDWHQTARDLLHAIAVGVAVGENVWEYDAVSHTNFVRRVDFRHGHRFRYDESWQLRLYDSGRKHGEGSRYGEMLDPRCFTVHQFRVVASYPSMGGIMRGCIYPWLFGRWVDKFWIGSTEKYGTPLLYARVPGNTPDNVRRKIVSDLENLANDGVGAMDDTVTIEAESAAAATKSWEGYQAYLQRRDAKLDKCWLGATDITSPGEHGSQAAVDTRASVALDPRMVTDGEAFAASLQRTLFKQLITLNEHKFSCPVEQVPPPSMKLKTADDEVSRDASGLQAEQQAQQQGYTPEAGRNMSGDMQGKPGQPQPGAPKQPPMQLLPEPSTVTMSYGDMLSIVKASSAGDIGKDAAYEMICAGGIASETAMRMVGIVQRPTFVASTADPKAVAPGPSPGRTTRTQPTSSRSRSPFAKALRSGSAGSAFSSSKASRKQP